MDKLNQIEKNLEAIGLDIENNKIEFIKQKELVNQEIKDILIGFESLK